MQRIKLGPNFSPHARNNSKWSTDLNVKPEQAKTTIK